MSYDQENVFARILRGEIPCRRAAESEHTLAFWDASPQAPVHVLVIPKGPYETFSVFSSRASTAEIDDLFRLVGRLAKDLEVDETGYRLVANSGRDGHQEVAHFHLHLVGGGDVGPMFSPPAREE